MHANTLEGMWIEKAGGGLKKVKHLVLVVSPHSHAHTRTGFSPLATPAQVKAALAGEHGVSGNGVIAESIVEEKARDGFVILDVRTLGEWNEGHVKGAKHVPIDELRGQVMVLAEETAGKTIYVHCKSGYRGHLALRILKEHGFQVYFGRGGRGEPACLDAYERKGGGKTQCPPSLIIISFVCVFG